MLLLDTSPYCAVQLAHCYGNRAERPYSFVSSKAIWFQSQQVSAHFPFLGTLRYRLHQCLSLIEFWTEQRIFFKHDTEYQIVILHSSVVIIINMVAMRMCEVQKATQKSFLKFFEN